MDKQRYKLLILAGNAIHEKVVETANKMGIYTIVTDNIPDSPAKRIACESLMFSVSSVDEIVDWCKHNDVDGVLNFCNDFSQRPCQSICDKLGLPFFGTKDHVAIFTDKNTFKRTCLEHGIDVIPFYSPVDVEKQNIQFPVLVKPNDSRGSRGLSVCHNLDELQIAIQNAKKESSNGEVLIEKYMGGKQDFTVTYFVYDGNPTLIQIGDRYLGEKKDGLDRQAVCQLSPSYLTEEFLKVADSKIKKMLSSVGIMNGPVFMQGFYDDGVFRFYDPGIRFPGTEYERAILETTGFDIIKKTIELALSINHKDECIPKKLFVLNGNYCFQLFIDIGPGVVSSIKGLDEVSKIKEVIFISQRIAIGDVVVKTGDVRQRIFEILVIFKNTTNKEYVKSTIKKIQRSLHVFDEKGSEMLISPFNIDYYDNYN